jgi:coenzyme PQQ precursor peptide PqqA
MHSVGTECCSDLPYTTSKGTAMKWTTPAATDLRFGFEVTMYIAAR